MEPATTSQRLRAHWQRIHAERQPEQVSWYEPRPQISLELIDGLGLTAGARVIDVGAGSSTLVDHLLERGLEVTVVDVSGAALRVAQERLGARADGVRWLEGDLLALELGPPHALWHDRAVFHFMTEPEQRARYRDQLARSLRPGGHAIIATFAEDGPERCSGLRVQRYSKEALTREVGDAFELVQMRRAVHTTPGGDAQRFRYGLFRKCS